VRTARIGSVMFFVLGLSLIIVGLIVYGMTQAVTTYAYINGVWTPNGQVIVHPNSSLGLVTLLFGILAVVIAFLLGLAKIDSNVIDQSVDTPTVQY